LKGYKVYGRAGAGAGIIVRTEFFFGKNQGKKLKKKSLPPPLSNNFCVVSRNGGQLGYRTALTDTILRGTHPGTILARFGLIWFSGFRGEDLNVIFYQAGMILRWSF
jgi:hypothetical protein